LIAVRFRLQSTAKNNFKLRYTRRGETAERRNQQLHQNALSGIFSTTDAGYCETIALDNKQQVNQCLQFRRYWDPPAHIGTSATCASQKERLNPVSREQLGCTPPFGTSAKRAAHKKRENPAGGKQIGCIPASRAHCDANDRVPQRFSSHRRRLLRQQSLTR